MGDLSAARSAYPLTASGPTPTTAIAKKENPFNGFSLPIIEWPQAI